MQLCHRLAADSGTWAETLLNADLALISCAYHWWEIRSFWSKLVMLTPYVVLGSEVASPCKSNRQCEKSLKCVSYLPLKITAPTSQWDLRHVAYREQAVSENRAFGLPSLSTLHLAPAPL